MYVKQLHCHSEQTCGVLTVFVFVFALMLLVDVKCYASDELEIIDCISSRSLYFSEI